MKIVKTLFIALGIAVLGTGLYLGGLYWGLFPLPEPVIASIARAQGLSGEEAVQISRVANLYQVVKTAPEAPIFDKALSMAMNDAPEGEWKRYVVESWPRISDETLRRVQKQLLIEDADFLELTAMIDTRIAAAAAQPENLDFTSQDLQIIERLDAKYGFSKVFGKFAQGSGKAAGEGRD